MVDSFESSTDLPELIELERVLSGIKPGSARIEVLTRIKVKSHDLPVYGIAFGPEDKNVPTLLITAGVHGLERIGSRVVISHIHTMAQLMQWDEMINETLKRLRIIFVPIVNPGGMLMRRRSNPNGVDLMRNAPVEAEGKSRFPLVGGHRVSPVLPWYRGLDWEAESKALCDYVRREVFGAKVSLALDIHSGFGTVDRLWFPYAKSHRPFPNIAEMMRLKNLLDQTHPNHVYVVEPQSQSYTTHGDLWDFLYDENRVKEPEKVFIPMALELGSWLWVKKNPRQMLTLLGAFNPLIPHRYQRILRRHVTLLEFLQRATIANKNWAFPTEVEKALGQEAANSLWFNNVEKG